jgi:hypothetical protein
LKGFEQDGSSGGHNGQEPKCEEGCIHGYFEGSALGGNIGNDIQAKKLQPHNGECQLENDIEEGNEANNEDRDLRREPPVSPVFLVKSSFEFSPYDGVSTPEQNYRGPNVNEFHRCGKDDISIWDWPPIKAKPTVDYKEKIPTIHTSLFSSISLAATGKLTKAKTYQQRMTVPIKIILNSGHVGFFLLFRK